MRTWIVIGGGILILAGALWPFNNQTEQLTPVPVSPEIAQRRVPAETPPSEPVKIREVIDLSRAYEPVREPEEPVEQASYIQIPAAPREIPPALESGEREPERIGVMPREVSNSAVQAEYPSKPDFAAAAVYEFDSGKVLLVPQRLSPDTSVILSIPAEKLKVMPREVK